MWFNFKNLLMTDIEDVISGEKTRVGGHMLSKDPVEVYFRESRINKMTKFYCVTFRTDDANDPKLHFMEQDKAEAFYKKLCDLVINPVNYIEIDVLAEGAV